MFVNRALFPLFDFLSSWAGDVGSDESLVHATAEVKVDKEHMGVLLGAPRQPSHSYRSKS